MKRQNCRKQSRGAHAFTLVELLVVISIIALLVAILLPSLKNAREQAKRVKCMANLKSVNTAMITYMLTEEEAPIKLQVVPGAGFGFCSWSFGGWSGKNKAHYTVYGGGKYYIPTPERPLTAYMYRKTVLREETEVPEYECPSDRVSSQGSQPTYFNPAFSGTAPWTRYNTYDDVGTSYQLNTFWIDQGSATSSSSLEGWLEEVKRGQTLWKRYMQSHAARFVTLVEDPADAMLRLVTGKQIVGFHKQFSRHVFAFLDGHVDYFYADTREKYGAEWTVWDELLIKESLNN